MDIKTLFFDSIPLKRKSAADWIIPAFSGLGVGLAVGIGIGMLSAPERGEVARLRLREGASRMRDKAADFAERAKSQLQSASSQAQNQLSRS